MFLFVTSVCAPNMFEKHVNASRVGERINRLTYRDGSVACANINFSSIMHPDKKRFLILKSNHMVLKIHNLHVLIQVVSIK